MNCVYCNKECKNENSLRNHIRFCKCNPNRKESPFVKFNSEREHGENQYTKAKRLGLSKPEISEETRKKLSETAKNRKHSEETKKKLSDAAKRNNFGGWHTSKVVEYNGIKLDSSYELTFAQDLDKNNIKWERPKPLYWKLDDSEHRYYPDFFLPEYGVYVDTKNDFLINNVNPRFGITDSEKIKLVEAQNNVKILILDKENLSWQCLLRSLSGR